MGEPQFAVRERIVADIWAQEKYEKMTEEQKKKILYVALYKKIKQRKIIVDYLAKNLSQSLMFSEVNGTPDKREERIRELAIHKYNNMPEQERQKIINKLNND
jgi:hypothetical protein